MGKDGRSRRGKGSQSLKTPLPTVTASNDFALVSAFLAKHHTGTTGQRLDKPAPTFTTIPTQNHIVAASLTRFYGTGVGQKPNKPLPVITALGNHFGLVAAFLTKFNRTGKGQRPDMPLQTASTIARFGVVTVEIQGETYAIVDIGMRMLTPRELANCQGFSPSYVLTGTKRDQVRRIGNSVCPQVAAALVRAQHGIVVQVARPRRRRSA